MRLSYMKRCALNSCKCVCVRACCGLMGCGDCLSIILRTAEGVRLRVRETDWERETPLSDQRGESPSVAGEHDRNDATMLRSLRIGTQHRTSIIWWVCCIEDYFLCWWDGKYQWNGRAWPDMTESGLIKRRKEGKMMDEWENSEWYSMTCAVDRRAKGQWESRHGERNERMMTNKRKVQPY